MNIPQQPLRLKTEPGATSYYFPIEDATGFPNTLPKARKIGRNSGLPADFIIGKNGPARKIPPARRALTGLQPTTKAPHKGHFESSLERDLYIQLEFDPIVQSWHPQPVRIPLDGANAFYPDVGVEYLQFESERNNFPPWMLYEVKYTSQLREEWHQLRPKFKAALRFAKARGWGFQILTERDIRTDYLFNAKFLLPYMAHPPTDAWAEIRRFLARHPPMTPRGIISTLRTDRWEQAVLLTHVWTLVARRDIQCDLLKKISMDTEIWIERR